MRDKVEGVRLRGCYYLFGKITAMVEAHEDHRLVQLQERQAAAESHSWFSRIEFSFGLLDWSCHPHQGAVCVWQEALSAGFFLIGSKRNFRDVASFSEVLVQV